MQFTQSNSEFWLYRYDKYTYRTCLSKNQYAIPSFFTTTNTGHELYMYSPGKVPEQISIRSTIPE